MTEFYWDPNPEVRTRHLYLPGQTGTGKTSLMANLALDDIEFGDGPVIIIDPKGSKDGLVNRVIKHIPKQLIPDVFYISLKHPAPIDMMSFRDQFEKNLIRSDLMGILQRFVSFGSWGSTMQGTLNELIPTLLEATDTTFLDIGRFLESKKRRDEILEQVSTERRDWWEENRSFLKEAGPIITRMSNFKQEPLKTIVNCPRGSGINIADVIEKNQILLVDTSPLGSDGLMVGALVMSRIQQAIFRRDPDKEYPVCTVYADEFHHFQTSAFGEMLTQARSFNLSLCLANQHPGQIKDIWDDVKGVWTYLLFRMDGEHAYRLRSKIKDPIVELPPPPVESKPKRTKQEIKDSLKFWRAQEKYWGDGPGSHEEGSGVEFNHAFVQISLFEDMLEELNEPKSKPIEPPKPIPFLDQIPSLPRGEAIFIHHSGETRRIKLVGPPIPPPFNYMKEIIEHTHAACAKSGQKRSGDNPSSNSTQVLHTEGNEEPTPGAAPSHHISKARSD
jgi:hypothetical protein